MAEIQYKRGEFRSYRAITTVHLGAIEDNLVEGEVVEFDGTTVKRGPDEHQIVTLRAAIKVGWLVPDEEEGGKYVPLPADVRIHDREAHGNDRGEGRRVGTVAEEERDLGHLSEIRAPGSPEVHVAARSGEISRGAPTGAVTVDKNLKPVSTTTAHGQEGEVVGQFKTSAKAEAVVVGKDDGRVKQDIEKTTGVQIIKATGDVSEARVGDDLGDLLPDAASSGKPEGGIAGEGMSDEDILAKRQAESAAKAEAQRQARRAQLSQTTDGAKATVSRTGDPISNTEAHTSDPGRKIDTSVVVVAGSLPVGGAEDGEIVGRVGETPPAVPVADPEVPVADPEVPSEAIVQAKIEVIKQFVPGFEWDMSMQWAKRAKLAVEKYGANLPVINGILSIETPAVRKDIMRRLYGSD